MKKSATFTIPQWALCALVNGDVEGLSEDDIENLNSFESKYPNLTLSTKDNDEGYFKSSNDIDNLGNTCFDCFGIWEDSEIDPTPDDTDLEIQADSLDFRGYNGIDCTPIISLGEYGFMGKDDTEKKEVHAFYRSAQSNTIESGWISYSDIEEKMNMSKESFLSFVGMSESEWLEMDAVNKVSDLLNYWGSLEIFGD